MQEDGHPVLPVKLEGIYLVDSGTFRGVVPC